MSGRPLVPDSPPVAAVVFDLGKVLIDWDPRYLYQKYFEDDRAAMERFLADVCSMAWHTRCDAGVPMADNVRALAARHPGQAALIAAWDAEWPAMFRGPIEGTVRLLEALDARGMPLFAITNYPGDKWAQGLAQFPFLGRFRAVLVSGIEKLAKPDPAIFRLSIERFGITPATTLFIDDLAANVAAAAALGFQVHHFAGPEGLAQELARKGLL
ncbi:HAD family phosphatase [Oleomonas cavernae]|uniref:HAD family phosphatase n=1 Tax=Oleomonas cavernae TaxID=2320859 RepID=A0A418WGL5_9PROT|nr:HAD family phosphatase [Oleomonas cavernae]RJF89183.1 HAD family phosphatase [Oleomonas cavernae]